MPSTTPNKDFYLPDDGEGDPDDPSTSYADEKNSDWADLDTLLEHISADGQTYSPPKVDTDELSGSWGTLVTSTAELESAFANLVAGETVAIAQPDTPYRTTQWLNIDVSNVRIITESPFAADGQPLVKVGDAANVGGIRIGHAAHTEHVTIDGFGIHGNPTTQDPTVKALHGIQWFDAQHVTIRGCVGTQFHPYHEHNTGGSHISGDDRGRDIQVLNTFTYDTGDRAIQLGGERITCAGNVGVNGFDRCIATNCTDSDGFAHHADSVLITGNTAVDNSEGSAYGISSESQDIAVVGNRAHGEHRTFCRATDANTDILIAGNLGTRNAGIEGAGVIIESTASDSMIVGNTFVGYPQGGVDFRGPNCTAIGNHLVNLGSTGMKLNGTNARAIANYVEGTTDQHCVVSDQPDAQIGWNILTDSAGMGLLSTGQNATIAHNRIDNPAGKSMDVRGATPLIVGNDCTNGNAGIVLSGADARVKNNAVRSHVFENILVEAAATDARLADNVCAGVIEDNGTRTRFNGVGGESAAAETPTAANWDRGEIVDFTDTGDGTGDGIYLKLPDETFAAIA